MVYDLGEAPGAKEFWEYTRHVKALCVPRAQPGPANHGQENPGTEEAGRRKDHDDEGMRG